MDRKYVEYCARSVNFDRHGVLQMFTFIIIIIINTSMHGRIEQLCNIQHVANLKILMLIIIFISLNIQCQMIYSNATQMCIDSR